MNYTDLEPYVAIAREKNVDFHELSLKTQWEIIAMQIPDEILPDVAASFGERPRDVVKAEQARRGIPWWS